MLEKGPALAQRVCPITLGKINTWRKCTVCNRLSGFGGLGKSEGRFNYTVDFGGELQDKMRTKETLKAMKTVDKILCSFGTEEITL